MSELYDVIVVGAGIVGSATAYQLIKNGAGKVLLLEQFSPQHTRGSSHGSTRMTRRAYVEPFYVHMMDEAYKLWSQLEEESESKLYIRTGILAFGPQVSPPIHKVIKSLQHNGVPHSVFSGEEALQKYSDQLKLPPNYLCVTETDGGILLAARALAAFQKLFLKSGGVLLDNQQVTDITPGHVITLKTASGIIFHTKKLVITAGAWASKIMRTLGVELPFQVLRTEVHYWKVANPENFSPANFPVFIHYGARDEPHLHFYGLPVHEYPGLLKVCLHTGQPVDPDHRDGNPVPYSTKFISDFISKFLKDVSPTPSIYEACMYTVSPDDNPVIDRHPIYPNIIVGAGFSGHGFKLSPVMGKVLSELAMDIPTSYDLSPFKIGRFKQQSKL